MKFIAFFISQMLFSAITASSQPIIDVSNIPKIGDVFYHQYTKLGGVNMGISGSTQTWDYSILVDSTETGIDSIISNSEVPNPSEFPLANLVSHFLDNENGIINSQYSYYKKSDSSLKTLGFQASIFKYYYRNPINTWLRYPFTYGDSFVDSSYLIVQYSGGLDSLMFIDSVTATGYGTLMLPHDLTHNNVLQVKLYITQKIGSNISKSTNVLYFQPGIPMTLLETNFNEDGTVSHVKYLKDYLLSASSVFTFNGNGNWSDSSNWLSNIPPPNFLGPGMEIKISPAQPLWQCLLDIPVTIPNGAKLTLLPNAKFIVQGNLTIQ